MDRLRYAQAVLTDTDFIDADITTLGEKFNTIATMPWACIQQNAANTVTEKCYRAAHADLRSRFEDTRLKRAALQKRWDKMNADAVTIGCMMFAPQELDDPSLVLGEKL